jgi:hypothetical protein
MFAEAASPFGPLVGFMFSPLLRFDQPPFETIGDRPIALRRTRGSRRDAPDDDGACRAPIPGVRDAANRSASGLTPCGYQRSLAALGQLIALLTHTLPDAPAAGLDAGAMGADIGGTRRTHRSRRWRRLRRRGEAAGSQGHKCAQHDRRQKFTVGHTGMPRDFSWMPGRWTGARAVELHRVLLLRHPVPSDRLHAALDAQCGM